MAISRDSKDCVAHVYIEKVGKRAYRVKSLKYIWKRKKKGRFRMYGEATDKKW